MPKVSPEIQFFICGEHGVLFHPAIGKLWVLNPVAATIWCLLPDVPDRRALSNQVAQRFGIVSEQAEQDVVQCLDCFQRDGLLEGGQPDVPVRGNPLDIHLDEVEWQVPPEWALEAVIGAPGSIVRFCSQDRQLGEQFVAIVRHLQVDKQVAVVDADLVLAREREKDGWSVFLDGLRYVGGVADNEILPHLHFLLCLSAMRRLADYFLFHGAVLERDGTSLLLPGEAGSGKTTLAALLAAEGWRLYSDELVVLDIESGEILPFPMPMSIKPGSVAVLASLYPELKRARVWDRDDGKRIRYLMPPVAALPVEPDERTVPTFLVFPKYMPGATTHLAGMGKIETLQRLAAVGSSDRCLRGVDVEAMIGLAERCAAFSLVYDDAREASKLIGRDRSGSGVDSFPLRS